MPYRLEFSTDARNHLRDLTARERSLVLDAIEAQLIHQPTAETRNRKRLRSNELAVWELRVGVLRVYYDVPADLPEPAVMIRAIGTKHGNRVRIGGEERTL